MIQYLLTLYDVVQSTQTKVHAYLQCLFLVIINYCDEVMMLSLQWASSQASTVPRRV